MKKIFVVILLTFFGLGYSVAFGQIDAQWRGPNRDGIYPNESLLNTWPKEGPKLLWSDRDDRRKRFFVCLRQEWETCLESILRL